MNELRHFSQNELRTYFRELSEFHKNLQKLEIPFDESQILFESDVCKILQISERTLRNYRKKKYFRYMKIEGRIVYLKFFFYLDLLDLFYRQNGDGFDK